MQALYLWVSFSIAKVKL